YQLPFAEAVKAAVPEANVMAVGMIVTPQQAKAVLTEGKADLIAVARAVLDDPNWGQHAAAALGAEEALPVQYERADATHWPRYAAARSARGPAASVAAILTAPFNKASASG